MKLTLPDQTHWVLLSREPVEVADGPVAFAGAAAVVKQWADGRAQLILLAPGRVARGKAVLTGHGPATAALAP